MVYFLIRHARARGEAAWRDGHFLLSAFPSTEKPRELIVISLKWFFKMSSTDYVIQTNDGCLEKPENTKFQQVSGICLKWPKVTLFRHTSGTLKGVKVLSKSKILLSNPFRGLYYFMVRNMLSDFTLETIKGFQKMLHCSCQP